MLEVLWARYVVPLTETRSCPVLIYVLKAGAIPEFSLTSHGIRAHLPLVRLSSQLISVDLRRTGDYGIALLACQVRNRKKTMFVGLVLRRDPGSYLYKVGAPFKGAGFVRYVTMHPDDPKTKELLGLRGDMLPTYRWSDLYISQPIGSQSNLISQPFSPHPDIAKAQYMVIPGWFLNTLREQGFDLQASTRDPYLPRLIRRPSARDPLFVFTHPEKSIQIRIHADWCERDNGLWLSVEFVDPAKYVAVLAEDIHASSDARFVCALTHVKDWSRSTPASPTRRLSIGSSPDPFRLRWTRHREFTALGRTVNLSLVDPSADRSDSMDDPRDELWVLGIDVSLPSDAPPIPTSNPPPLSQEPQAIALRKPIPLARNQGQNDFKCTFPSTNPYQPRPVDASHGQMYTFLNSRRHEEVRVHIGWCDHDRGMWACVEFVDTTTNGPRCPEAIHDDVSIARDVRLAGCSFTHVKDWDLITADAMSCSGEPIQRSAPLSRCRTFTALERTVRLRLSRESVRTPLRADTRGISDDTWVLDVEFPVRWKTTIPRIPPPRLAPGTPSSSKKELFASHYTISVSSGQSPTSSMSRGRRLWARLRSLSISKP